LPNFISWRHEDFYKDPEEEVMNEKKYSRLKTMLEKAGDQERAALAMFEIQFKTKHYKLKDVSNFIH
jgi:hypothetical protein